MRSEGSNRLGWTVEGIGRTNAVTDIPGLRVGQYEKTASPYLTGATVLVFPQGVVAGVDVRGGAPGTRQTDSLGPWNMVEHIHGIALSGGSGYGLDVACGVMEFLEEQNIGLRVGDDVGEVVPLVPAAILFDLGRGGGFRARPNADFGYRAAKAASTSVPRQGNAGAGTGARSGGLKGGVGTASAQFKNGVTVGAIVAVNSRGHAVDRQNGTILGTRLGLAGEFADVTDPDVEDVKRALATDAPEPRIGLHTTIAVVATSAKLSKVEAGRMATVAHDGLAQAIRPVHTLFDGDTVFGVATGADEIELDEEASTRPDGRNVRAEETVEIYAAASDALARAVAHAMLSAESAGGMTAYVDQYPSAVKASRS